MNKDLEQSLQISAEQAKLQPTPLSQESLFTRLIHEERGDFRNDWLLKALGGGMMLAGVVTAAVGFSPEVASHMNNTAPLVAEVAMLMVSGSAVLAVDNFIDR